jgi:hypothetical protein
LERETSNKNGAAGGFMGCGAGEFYDCINEGSVTSAAYAGGFVGISYFSLYSENSKNTGTVTARNEGYAGGVFGMADDSFGTTIEITNFTNSGTVTSTNGNACGFGFYFVTGTTSSVQITNSQNTGTVTSTNGKTYDQIGYS